MFEVIRKYLSVSGFLILKVFVLVLVFVISVVAVFETNSFSSINIANLFDSSYKVNHLNTHLADSKWSTDLEKLKMSDITPEEAEIFLFILKLSDSITPTNARKLAKVIIEECGKHDLDPFLILAVIQTESSFTPEAVSPKGAIGLMQVMPKTGEFIAKDKGISFKGISSLYDPFINVKLGIHYLSILEDQFNSLENALAAYNYGPTKFANSKSLADNPPSYVRKVLNFKTFLEAESILLAKNS